MDTRPELSASPKSSSFHTQDSCPGADSIETQRQRLAVLVGQLLAEQWLRECQAENRGRRDSEEPGAGSSRLNHPREPTLGVP